MPSRQSLHSPAGGFIVISKILAGVFAIAVLTVGGYAYWQYADGTADTPTQPSGCSSQPTPMPPCCQEPSRSTSGSTDTVVPCCEMPTTANPLGAEELTIPPREIK
jgi:hypothetical protein